MDKLIMKWRHNLCMYVPTVCPEIWLPDFGIMDTFLNVGMVYVIKNQSLRVLIVQVFISVSSCPHTSDFHSIHFCRREVVLLCHPSCIVLLQMNHHQRTTRPTSSPKAFRPSQMHMVLPTTKRLTQVRGVHILCIVHVAVSFRRQID